MVKNKTNRLIISLIKNAYKLSEDTKWWNFLDSVLKEQGLEYCDGEIKKLDSPS